MAYARLDDVFPEHPKVAALSDRAFRVHVRGICYSAKTLSDGFVPLALGREWGRRATVELEDAALWVPTATGWFIHDYLNYNPSRGQVTSKRQADSERKRGGIRRDSEQESDATPRARSRTPLPSLPPVVGVDPVPDPPIAVGNSAAPMNGKGKDGASFFLADVVNLGLVTSLVDRYRRRGWDKAITPGLLTGLVLGSESKKLPACGPKAVNAAIDDLYANAAGVKDPAGYLKDRAVAYAGEAS